METLVVIGLIAGLAAGIAGTVYFYKNQQQRIAESQSHVLLEKIKQVSKLITVEGEFSEIFTHRNARNLFFNLWQTEKKALLIVKAKVLVGFDLTKININIDTKNKVVKLSHFPDPEILSIDNDLEYYDVQKGMINQFSDNDLTELNKKSKDFIREKVKRSHLFKIARNQANDTIQLIRQLIDSVGWQLHAENFLPENEHEKIENS
jgi:hypothetical protein